MAGIKGAPTDLKPGSTSSKSPAGWKKKVLHRWPAAAAAFDAAAEAGATLSQMATRWDKRSKKWAVPDGCKGGCKCEAIEWGLVSAESESEAE